MERRIKINPYSEDAQEIDNESIVEFKVKGGPHERIRIQFDGDKVYVSGDGALIIEPIASNTFNIFHRSSQS